MVYALPPVLAPLLVMALAVGPGVASAEEAVSASVSPSRATDAAEGPGDLPLLEAGSLEAGSLEAGVEEAGVSEGALSGAGLAPLPPGVGIGEPRPVFAPLPAVASVAPGLLLHGLGPLLAGDTHTAKRLFALEGAALGLTAAGLVPIALTGASRRTIGPLYALTLSGVGLFGLSAIANLYAAAAPTFEPGVPPPHLPPLELELGYQHVNDPHFDYRHFLSLGARARWDAVRLETAAHLSPDDGNTRVRLGGAYRLLGAFERALAGSDGSSLDVEVGAFFHRFPTEDFSRTGTEFALRGRYAMARLSPRLAGSFAEMSLGMAFYGYHFSGGITDDALYESLHFTFGYGVWLGRGGGPLRGEAVLYYSHRKDDFAGGLIAMGDIPGHFGLRGRVLLTERWGVAAELQAGSAYVGRLSLVYALGGAP